MNIREAVNMIKESRHITVITGAGISTNAGIPDYRGNNGIYKADKKELFTREFYENNTKQFYKEIGDLMSDKVIPTKAHFILGDWLAKGIIKKIYTQNIDTLHTKGYLRHADTDEKLREVKNLIRHVHGKYNVIWCKGCERKILIGPKFNPEKYECKCGCTEIDTDIVLFGDIPYIENDDYVNMMNTDLTIIIGTSGMVNTIYSLIEAAGCSKRIYINLEETGLDRISDVVIHSDIDEVLEAINNQLNTYK